MTAAIVRIITLTVTIYGRVSGVISVGLGSAGALMA